MRNLSNPSNLITNALSDLYHHSPIGRVLAIGAVAATMLGTVWSSYSGYWNGGPLSKSGDVGRTKNSIVAVVSGLVAQKAYGDSNFDFVAEKLFWPDAGVNGSTSGGSIDSAVDLSYGHAYFTGHTTNGKLTGTVDKTEFDWDVVEQSSGHYEIGRAALKFDHALDLKVSDGVISGTLNRGGLGLTWTIDGSYTPDGFVRYHLSCPMSGDVTVSGMVQSFTR